MAIDGITERRATITQLETIPGLTGLVWKGAMPEADDVPRDEDGRILPHLVVDFGAPIQAKRDRALANGEKGQPHLLTANVACISGDVDWSEDLMKAVVDVLVDWKPSATSDPWELKGGYGSNRPATGSVPMRLIEGLFLECATNQGPDGS